MGRRVGMILSAVLGRVGSPFPGGGGHPVLGIWGTVTPSGGKGVGLSCLGVG